MIWWFLLGAGTATLILGAAFAWAILAEPDDNIRDLKIDFEATNDRLGQALKDLDVANSRLDRYRQQNE